MVSDRPDVSMGSMLGAQEMAEVRVGGGGVVGNLCPWCDKQG